MTDTVDPSTMNPDPVGDPPAGGDAEPAGAPEPNLGGDGQGVPDIGSDGGAVDSTGDVIIDSGYDPETGEHWNTHVGPDLKPWQEVWTDDPPPTESQDPPHVHTIAEVTIVGQPHPVPPTSESQDPPTVKTIPEVTIVGQPDQDPPSPGGAVPPSDVGTAGPRSTVDSGSGSSQDPPADPALLAGSPPDPDRATGDPTSVPPTSNTNPADQTEAAGGPTRDQGGQSTGVAEPISDWDAFVDSVGAMAEWWAQEELDKLKTVWENQLGRGFVAGTTGLPIEPPTDAHDREEWDKGQELAAIAALADMIAGGFIPPRSGPMVGPPEPVPAGGVRFEPPPGAGVRDTHFAPPAHLNQDTPPAAPEEAQAAAGRSRQRADELAAAAGYTGYGARDGTVGVMEVQRTIPTPGGPDRVETKVLVSGSSPEVEARLEPLLGPGEELVVAGKHADARDFENGTSLHAEHNLIIKVTSKEMEGWIPTGGAASNHVCGENCRKLVETPDLGGHVMPDKKGFWFEGPASKNAR